jgi:hypothetical protein
MKPAIKQPSNSQSVDRKMLLLLRRKGAQTIEGLAKLMGIGWGKSSYQWTVSAGREKSY